MEESRVFFSKFVLSQILASDFFFDNFFFFVNIFSIFFLIPSAGGLAQAPEGDVSASNMLKEKV